MDANGTKFHLLYDRDDWEACVLANRGLPLRAFADPALDNPPAELKFADGALQLRQELIQFPKLKDPNTNQSAQPEQLLRGATRDDFGTVYWISEDLHEIRARTSDASTEDADEIVWRWANASQPSGEAFVAVPDSSDEPLSLRGLVMTRDQYLVAGVRHGNQGAVLAIDRYSHGAKWLQPDQNFMPESISQADEGGVWVLDKHNQNLWRIYTTPQFVENPAAASNDFSDVPNQPDTGPVLELRTFQHWPLSSIFDSGSTPEPIAVARGPRGNVLILVQIGLGSALYECQPNAQTGDFKHRVHPLTFPVLDALTDTSVKQDFSAVAMAYVDYMADCPIWLTLSPRPGEPIPLVVVADAKRAQALAYRFNYKPSKSPANLLADQLEIIPNFLPLRHWGGVGFFSSGCRVYYDDAAARWLPLQSLDEQRFASRGTLNTPADFPAALPVQPFDGELDGCVWHRLVIDGVIPAGSAVNIRARAADAPDLLSHMPWLDQPAPYLRGAGSELPYFQLPVFKARDPATQPTSQVLAAECLPGPAHEIHLQEQRAGSWELLFQDVRGRYVQLEITLEGTGRNTPQLYALRAWYPRFSYLQNYLPAVYREDTFQASFLDRWLANFEGFFTHIEDQINRFPSMIDPRTAPVETLEWLAGWMGLLLDPQWTEGRRRFFIRHAMDFYRLRGTPIGLELTLRLYLDDEQQIGDEIFQSGQSQSWRVRVSEDFQTVVAMAAAPQEKTKLLEDAANQFTVLVPSNLSDEQADMITRIVTLERPAYTRFKIERRADQFILDCTILNCTVALCDPVTISTFNFGDPLTGDVALPLAESGGIQITLDENRLCDVQDNNKFVHKRSR